MTFLGVAILALLAGLITVVVNAGRHRESLDARNVRRVFQYAVLYALVVVSAIGATELLGRLLGAEAPAWQDDSYALAQALTFVLVGVPLAALLAWWTWRSHRASPAETRSPLFTTYLTIAALTGLVVAAAGLQVAVFEAIDHAEFDAQATARFVVWAAVWLGHWIVARRSLDVAAATPHLLLGSLVGLVLAATGLIQLLGTSLDLLLRPGAVVPPLTGLARGAGLLTAGGLVWIRYWVLSASRLPRQVLWLAYVLLIGVAGGLIMAIAAVSMLLWTILVWIVGDRLDQTFAQHFDSTAMQTATAVIGVVIWWYHRAAVGQSAAEHREIRRTYDYLVGGIALIAAASGVGTIIVALIEAATPGLDIGMPTINTLLAALTLLVVGTPVWWFHWRRLKAAVGADPAAEVAALSRRIYLVLLFGVAGVTAVVALLVAAYAFFRDLVDAQLGTATLRAMRYGLGVLVASAAVSAYHGAVFRQDRQIDVPDRPSRPRSVVLIGAHDPDLVRRIRQATDSPAELWVRTDAAAEQWDEESVLAALDGYSGKDLLVIADETGLRVLEVDRRR
jgi:hypothetical protein